MRYVCIFFALVAAPAFAYVGPGPGLSMLGSALGFLAAIAFALLVVIAYPLRLLYLKLRKRPSVIASEREAIQPQQRADEWIATSASPPRNDKDGV